jgi:hypothetical protein
MLSTDVMKPIHFLFIQALETKKELDRDWYWDVAPAAIAVARGEAGTAWT